MKIAMLAAATPHSTFSRTFGRSGGVQVQGVDLLLSVHPQDRAIAKLGVLGCQNFGASCLGARTEDVCYLQASLRATGHDARVFGYDFRRKPEIWGEETKSHDFDVYLRQASQSSTLLQDLMSREQLDGGTSAPSPMISCP